jgi:AraC-like DNA-binding protein
MNMIENYELLKMSYNVSGIPIHHVSASGKVLFSCPEIHPAANPLCTDRGLIEEFLRTFKKSDKEDCPPIVKMTQYCVCYAAIPCASGDGSILILGPSLYISITDSQIGKIATEHSIEDVDAFSNYVCSNDRPAVKRFLSACRMTHYLESGKLIDIDILGQTARVMPVAYYDFDKNLVHYIFNKRENISFTPPENAMRELIRLIVAGETHAACNYLKSIIETIEESAESVTLEDARIAFIGITSVIAYSMTNAGADRDICKSTENYYARQASTCHNCYSLNKLWSLMICAFGDNAIKQLYSKYVRACCNYISAHLHDKITLTQLARLTNLSPRYLSKLFKNETGQSILSYIQVKKINEAKTLLSFSDYSLAKISAYLNFSSQSYFSTRFLKHTGMTPQNYRDIYSV